MGRFGRTHIAEPLGLTTLGFGAPKGASDPRGHRRILGFPKTVQPMGSGADNPAWMGPAGTIHMSLADLVAWGQAHMQACKGFRPEFLSQESCRLMQTPEHENYGLGWVLSQQDAQDPVVWHNGSNTLWYSLLVMIPEQDLVLAASTNVMDAARIDDLARDLPALITAPSTDRP